MVAVPDLMGAYQRGDIDAEGVRTVQLAVISHCEQMGDRVAVLDTPPGLNAQQVRTWRMDEAGYDSRYATLYYPWVRVFDPASDATRPSRRAVTSPACGRAATPSAGCTRPPPTR